MQTEKSAKDYVSFNISKNKQIESVCLPFNNPSQKRFFHKINREHFYVFHPITMCMYVYELHN